MTNIFKVKKDLLNFKEDTQYLINEIVIALDNMSIEDLKVTNIKPLSEEEISELYYEHMDGYLTIEEVTKFVRLIEKFQKERDA